MQWHDDEHTCVTTLPSHDLSCDLNDACCMMSFCCRDDAPTDEPIRLPTESPFILLKVWFDLIIQGVMEEACSSRPFSLTRYQSSSLQLFHHIKPRTNMSIPNSQGTDCNFREHRRSYSWTSFNAISYV